MLAVDVKEIDLDRFRCPTPYLDEPDAGTFAELIQSSKQRTLIGCPQNTKYHSKLEHSKVHVSLDNHLLCRILLLAVTLCIIVVRFCPLRLSCQSTNTFCFLLFFFWGGGG